MSLNIKGRRFEEKDAKVVHNLIIRNFIEVNSKDYGIKFIGAFTTH